MATTHAIRTGIHLSAPELSRLPRGSARFELEAGELLVMEPGFAEHGQIAATVVALLHAHVRAHDLGRAFGAETGFLVTQEPDTVKAPDAAFVSHATIERVGDVRKAYWPGAPDVAVEVVSSGDRAKRVREKALMWIGAGCRLVLVVDPDPRTVTVYRPGLPPTILGEDEAVDCSDVVDGFRIDVAELFV